MEKINLNESADKSIVDQNINLIDSRIRTCSTVPHTAINVNPETGEVLSIGDGPISEESFPVSITIGYDVPDISDVFYGSANELSPQAREVVQETIDKWNKSLK